MTKHPRFRSLEVLAAVDSAFILLDLKDTLNDLGVGKVETATSAKDAMAVLQRCHCDVVILGLDSADATSTEFLEALELLHVPILVVANGVRPAYALTSLLQVELLSVPFDSVSLADAIDRLTLPGLMPPGVN